MDSLTRGESVINRVDSSLGKTQSAASRARGIASQPIGKVVLAVGVVAAIGAIGYYLSKQP